MWKAPSGEWEHTKREQAIEMEKDYWQIVHCAQEDPSFCLFWTNFGSCSFSAVWCAYENVI